MTDLFTPPEGDNPIAAYLPGPNNRYKTPEDIAKGKYEADLHIKKIEQENADLRTTNLQLREDNSTKAKMEEYLDKIKAAAASNASTSEGTHQQHKDDQPFDLNKLESYLKEREVSRTKEQNVKAVTDALKERFGNNYVDTLNKHTEELELDKTTMNYLAETSPKAFFRALGLDTPVKTESFTTPPRSSSLLAPKPEEQRTWSYYQKMRKEQPSVYSNPRTQAQMQQDYMKMGKAFEDGDFLAYGQESAF